MAGCRPFGEPEWKPHSCNVETNPYIVNVYNRYGMLLYYLAIGSHGNILNMN